MTGSWSQRERFADAYRTTYPSVARYCRRRSHADHVDDLVAEIYTVAWDKVDDFLGADSRLAWLYGVGFRVVSTHYRRQRRRRLLTAKLSNERPRFVQSPTSEAEIAEEVRLTFQAISQLSTVDQELIALAALEGLSYAEIGLATGRTETGARSALYRARQRLRDSLVKLGGGQ